MITRFVLRATFIFNLVFFLFICAILIRDVVLPGGDTAGIAFFLLFWGGGLIVHGAVAFNLFERFIDQAVQKEIERQELKQKPKRQRLGDDGELVETDDDEVMATGIDRSKETRSGSRTSS